MRYNCATISPRGNTLLLQSQGTKICGPVYTGAISHPVPSSLSFCCKGGNWRFNASFQALDVIEKYDCSNRKRGSKDDVKFPYYSD